MPEVPWVAGQGVACLQGAGASRPCLVVNEALGVPGLLLLCAAPASAAAKEQYTLTICEICSRLYLAIMRNVACCTALYVIIAAQMQRFSECGFFPSLSKIIK